MIREWRAADGMIPILSVLVIVMLSILVTRVATVALTHTGLSRESARFQSRSAFTGTGFTTTESEQVIGHPVRRRIIMLLMLVGNAGLVTVISGLVLTFVGRNSGTPPALKAGVLVAGLGVLVYLARSAWVDRRLSQAIDWALRRYTRLDVRDYASLMHLAGEYRIVELAVEESDWVANKTLAQARLRDEGVVVLAIRRQNGSYLGAPKGETEVLPGDVLVLYGRTGALEEIDRRECDPSGDREHERAVAQQQAVIKEEKAGDPAARESRLPPAKAA